MILGGLEQGFQTFTVVGYCWQDCPKKFENLLPIKKQNGDSMDTGTIQRTGDSQLPQQNDGNMQTIGDFSVLSYLQNR